MDKNVEISLLLSFYGNILTDKQQEAVSLYYNEDLSLAEIASNVGITRQGVRDAIKRAECQLFLYSDGEIPYLFKNARLKVRSVEKPDL